jgi:PAS domain S-box-containing protein
MATCVQTPLHDVDEDVALRALVEGTASATGERFFAALVLNLARALNTNGAWVTEYLQEANRLRALAFWMDGNWVEGYEVDITGTPCEAVIRQADLVHFPDRLLELYPHDPDITGGGFVSYMGVPLKDFDGRILGHMAVIDRRPMPQVPRAQALFQIFSVRAAAELQRKNAETKLREREEKLSRVVNGALDAIIELDANFKVTLMNPSAEKLFNCSAGWVVGQDFMRFLADESREKLKSLAGTIDCRPPGQQSLWIAGGLTAKQIGGGAFPAEATLSCFEAQRRTYYTLILRSENERLEAERKIRALTDEAEYLREEVKELHNFDEIVGQSAPLRRALRDVEQVAATDATVLILGETGTGKELFARAIHNRSPRREHPLVKVNCAAIPGALIESEFFGHERGAFTGATTKRVGRFELADGGTIFLDEVGELPLDLQGKLLRVLQEGEFEPVGSSTTRKVNVRVLAATNRNLLQEVKEGKFREDLYYRLNVFPLQVPPLRDRGEDIALLAASFAKRFALSMGRKLEPLSADCARRLKAYSWPGNVRELENVIERAVITGSDGRLNLDRALPEAESGPRDAGGIGSGAAPLPIRTADELLELERQNLLRALEAAEWRVAGESGAARILGMNPSTLSSRMKALGIKRPR